MNLSELLLLLFAAAASLGFLMIRCRRRAAKLPPGPYPLPMIGNLFNLSAFPPRSLANLSKTYGPLMSIQLGSRYAVVASSPETAKQILQTHDRVFSNRMAVAAMRAHGFHEQSMVCMPAGKQWRKLRKICRENLFSANRLDSSQVLRQDALRKLREYLQKCGGSSREVNIRQAVSVTLINLLLSTIFSAEPVEFDLDTYPEFVEAIHNVVKYVSAPNVADIFPILQPLDPQGIQRKLRHHLGKMLSMIEGEVNRRLESRSTLDYQKKKDLLETMLDLSQSSESEFTAEEINHLFLALIVGGADTSGTTVEWTMTELLLNPEKLRKAKDELRTVIGGNRLVQESDFSKLPYLRAVIKEAFRLYPSGPLLFPRIAESDVEINGYVIPKDAMGIVNVWAIGRDPNQWENPDSFEPERFLGKTINFTGQDFELIPFGAGRRICPGVPLAYKMVHSLLATLIHNFNWKFDASAEAAKTHRQEVSGISLQKSIPLKAIPINSKPQV